MNPHLVSWVSARRSACLSRTPPAGVKAAPAAGTEIVAVTTDLTRQKFRDTDLLDRSHVVDDPRALPTVVRHLISVHASLRAAEYICPNRPRREHADGGIR